MEKRSSMFHHAHNCINRLFIYCSSYNHVRNIFIEHSTEYKKGSMPKIPAKRVGPGNRKGKRVGKNESD